MKLIVGLIFMLLATTAHSLEDLKWGDEVEYSADGQNWYPAKYLLHDDSKYCIAGDLTGCDAMGQNDRHYIYHVSAPLAETNYIREPYSGPSKAELYGLLTRLENLITSSEPRAAFSTAANMMADRESLQMRINALREILKNE